MPAFLKKWSLSRKPWRSVNCCWCSSSMQRKEDLFWKLWHLLVKQSWYSGTKPNWNRCRKPHGLHGLGRRQLLLSVCCTPQCFQKISFLWCILDVWMSGNTFSLIIHSETSNSVHWLNKAGYLCLPSMALLLLYPVPLFILYLHSPELPFMQNNKKLAVYSTVMMSKNKNN